MVTSPSGRAPGTAGAPHERSALSRELSDFLIELSIALHKHAMYPQGHPSLGPAVARLLGRAATLLQDRPSISLGVARDQLVIEGVATDSRHPVLAELAGRLHRHHLGAVTFSRGLEPEEVTDALRTLAVEADRTGQPLGMGDPAKLSAWQHVRLYPLTYERLELLEGADLRDPVVAAGPADGTKDAEGAGRDARVRGAQLWIGMARAALPELTDTDEAPTKPAVIAKAIDDHAREAAYDQVIVGYLLQIARELKTSGGPDADELRKRTSRLIAEMRPDTLRRLIAMGGDTAQRRQFVLDASHGMAVEAVLEVVKAAADTSQHAVSGSLMRMLSKLAAHAEQGSAQARPLADHALRDQVRTLLTGWDLADPNPEGYGHALQRMSQAAPAVESASFDGIRGTEPERLIQMSLEVDAVGPNVYRACATMVDMGQLAGVVDLLEQAPETSAAIELWARAVSPDTLRWLLEAQTVDLALVDRLLPRLAERAADPLLDALAAAESRSTRRAILERLIRLGPVLGPSVSARLTDDRWYVKRNLLTLLDDLPELPLGFSALPLLADPDPRVRLEALKIGLKSTTERDAVITLGLMDTGGRIVRLALTMALRGLPATAVPRVVTLALDRQTPPDLRVQAIRVLGASEASEALDALLQLTDGGRTIFGRRKLPTKSREMLASLTALATGWGHEPRATEVLALAALSEDPQVRAATDPEGVAA
jgi:hypothetical protein